MDFQPELVGATLRLSPLAEAHREELYAAASDPLIWEQHPARTRHERRVFDTYFDFLLSMRQSLVVQERETARVIGTSRFYVAASPPESYSIGYTFLTRDHWGGPTNREMKSLMINHILDHVDEVWFHIGADNTRSQKGTGKLGAVRAGFERLDLGNGPADYVCYRLTRTAWEAQA